ncbi:Chorismate mutase I [Pseudonocardia sp. Ae168_Ps1]|uniref:chorismate mutase n=1 Tax=unclassified Pseudonocardia TaxID=2619320 RepID=UPI0001FFEC0F|nr:MULTISPECIES: chorismate mutase [unclassified Pseudonocardia]ALE72251.1 chorismate mutase [Pseudonocardia sp. EC080625-04]ALL75534.1 chorismate mutase [Pseudonocardia sp. EC080610-09]ALL82561.1 chorismate mutase [Pseudonocardia sp. EC080619-01]OLL74056.1 Chorismate mutase I [Pseudonocardia sp. Ae150A_Ps1]OLL80033.1 Chorismate mutase I [Pseudonocardia sp. Ae168_Ps1]
MTEPAVSHAPSGDSVPTGADSEIDDLRKEIDRLDSEILDAVLRRTEVSKRIGAARMAAGGPRIVYSREMAVLDRFHELGPEGRELALMLLRLGRGRLGGR